MDTNNHKGHRKRMREDFEKGGFKTWQKHKVLEYLLYNVIPVADTNDIAHNLIKECGGFVNVFHTSKKRLMSIDGVGEKTADYICSLGEFIQYYNTEKYNTDVFVLNSETSENYLCNLFDGKNRECCYMICLDPKNRIINQEMLFEGSFESVELDVAKVLRSAVKSDASQVVFTHNHPSGILKPSNADLVTTQALEHTLFFAGIKMLDHIIVADGKCMSILPYLKGSGMNAKINREIKKNKEINAYIKKGNDNLGVLGYTDHSQVHCSLVAERAALILEKFGYGEHETELAKIAGYMHDIGNSINRRHHAEYGALLANELLRQTDMSLEDRVTVVSAIANHDESTGGAVDIISAALVIADKTDVRRDRVRAKDRARYDIHDRVNYAVTESTLKISPEKKLISLNLQIDESICTMYDYFDIFLGRMQMCRHAAELFGARFKLTANGSKVL